MTRGSRWASAQRTPLVTPRIFLTRIDVALSTKSHSSDCPHWRLLGCVKVNGPIIFFHLTNDWSSAITLNAIDYMIRGCARVRTGLYRACLTHTCACVIVYSLGTKCECLMRCFFLSSAEGTRLPSTDSPSPV